HPLTDHDRRLGAQRGHIWPHLHPTGDHREWRARGRMRAMADVAVHTTITDRVAVLTLSHPARRNALNIALSALLAEAVQAAADDPEVGAIVVTGEDPAFCAGGDL